MSANKCRYILQLVSSPVFLVAFAGLCVIAVDGWEGPETLGAMHKLVEQQHCRQVPATLPPSRFLCHLFTQFALDLCNGVEMQLNCL